MRIYYFHCFTAFCLTFTVKILHTYYVRQKTKIISSMTKGFIPPKFTTSNLKQLDFNKAFDDAQKNEIRLHPKNSINLNCPE